MSIMPGTFIDNCMLNMPGMPGYRPSKKQSLMLPCEEIKQRRLRQLKPIYFLNKAEIKLDLEIELQTVILKYGFGISTQQINHVSKCVEMLVGKDR